MFQDFLNLLYIPGEMVLTLFISLTLAFLLGLTIALLYRSTHRGLNYEPSFLATLTLLAPIVALVMLFIQGDLVLSLGLVGSMSIIRFRTPIKDTRDMVYLFWVIAVGLGCGTNNWTLVFMSTIFLGIIISILYLLEYGRPKHADFVLVLSGSSPYPASDAEAIIRRHTVNARIRSYEVEGETWEVVIELRFNRKQEKTLDLLIQEVQNIGRVNRVSLLAPQLSLPM